MFAGKESGFALPAAMLLLLVIAAGTAVLSRVSVKQLSMSVGFEATADTFHVVEGALSDQIRQIALEPEAWKSLSALSSAMPVDYASYQPADYQSNNGIPSCTGMNCLRNLVPVGGGLLKNLGPIGGDGAVVDIDFPIYLQLNPDNPPAADITLNGLPAWVQLERLDTIFSPESGVGADLSTQGDVFSNAEVVRFRLTGYTLRNIKSRNGQSSIVMVIELPAT